MTSIGPNCLRCRESLLHLRPHLQLCVVIIRLPHPRSDLSPAVADIGAHVAMFENFSVRKLLGLFDRGSQKSHNGHGAVTRFLQIDANMPTLAHNG